MLVGRKIVMVCDRLNSGIDGTRKSQSIHIFILFCFIFTILYFKNVSVLVLYVQIARTLWHCDSSNYSG